MKKKIFIILLAFVLLISVTGCGKSNKTEEEKKSTPYVVKDKVDKYYNLGEKITYSNFDFEFTKAEVIKTTETDYALPNTEVIKVEMKIKNNSDKDIANPVYMFRNVGPNDYLVENDLKYVMPDSIAVKNTMIKAGEEVAGNYYISLMGSGEYRIELYDYVNSRVAVKFNIGK